MITCIACETIPTEPNAEYDKETAKKLSEHNQGQVR